MLRKVVRTVLVLGVFGLVVLCGLLAESAAQQAPRSGEELYVDVLGCWTCHGNIDDSQSSKSIVKPQMSLLRWLAYVRRPSGSLPAYTLEVPNTQMPPFAPILVSDAELAFLYRWLDGVEVFRTPLPIAVKVTESAPAGDRTLVAVASVADPQVKSEAPRVASLRYRVAVQSAEGPVANRALEYQAPGRTDWTALTTNDEGESQLPQGTGQLRMTLAPGRYAVVVEALDVTKAESPVPVGIGSVVLDAK